MLHRGRGQDGQREAVYCTTELFFPSGFSVEGSALSVWEPGWVDIITRPIKLRSAETKERAEPLGETVLSSSSLLCTVPLLLFYSHLFTSLCARAYESNLVSHCNSLLKLSSQLDSLMNVLWNWIVLIAWFTTWTDQANGYTLITT